jgi:hypothetical protein
MATTACWHLIHTDGPTKGQPYELDYGAPHFATHEEATQAAGHAHAAGQHIEPAQLPTPCATLSCAYCGRLHSNAQGPEHHDTQDQADQSAEQSGWTRRGVAHFCTDCTDHARAYTPNDADTDDWP